MPIYEFQCLDCSERFDELVGLMSQAKNISCPECRSIHVQKLMSAFGFSSAEKSSASSGSTSCSTCSSKNCSTCH